MPRPTLADLPALINYVCHQLRLSPPGLEVAPETIGNDSNSLTDSGDHCDDRIKWYYNEKCNDWQGQWAQAVANAGPGNMYQQLNYITETLLNYTMIGANFPNGYDPVAWNNYGNLLQTQGAGAVATNIIYGNQGFADNMPYVPTQRFFFQLKLACPQPSGAGGFQIQHTPCAGYDAWTKDQAQKMCARTPNGICDRISVDECNPNA